MLNIYVIDDNHHFSNAFKHVLHSVYPSAKIESFPGDENLLKIIEETPPNVIFLDINFQAIDGYELTKKVKEHNQDIVIIVVTGFDDDEYVTSAENAGADGFLSKNKITLEEIVKLKKSILPKNGS